MYKHILMERGQIFEENVALPKTAYVCANGLNVGNRLGMLSCTVTARTAVSAAAGAAVTVAFQHSDDNAAYTAHSTHAVTLAEALDTGPGGVVARFVLPPDAKPWIKAVVTLDGSGSVDVFAEYLAR